MLSQCCITLEKLFSLCSPKKGHTGPSAVCREGALTRYAPLSRLRQLLSRSSVEYGLSLASEPSPESDAKSTEPSSLLPGQASRSTGDKGYTLDSVARGQPWCRGSLVLRPS